MADVPPQEEGESPLERVRRRLYTNAGTPGAPAAHVDTVRAASEGWKPEVPKKRALSATAWFFVVAVGFFVVAGIAAALILFLGGRSVGNDRMSIRFEGPLEIDGGEEAPFDIVIENGNPVPASELVLSVDFPPEAFDPVTMEPLGHYMVPLPDLLSGGSPIRQSIRVVFFGAEDQKLSIPVTLEYRTPNSSAVFVKEEVRETTIASAPLSIRISAVPEVASGQKITLTASVRSNAPEVLKNAALKVEYPFGFSLQSAEPTSVGTNVFPLGDLAPGQEKEVTIVGSIIGEDGDERVFRFQGGVLPDAEATTLRTPAYTFATADVAIARSFLALTLSLNQQSGDIVASAGESVQASLTFINSLASTVADGEIRIALSGDALDANSVDVVNGLYRANERTIIFDENTEAGLRNLAPGESGAGAFRFSLKSEEELRQMRNPSVTLTVSVSGRRVGDGGRVENLTSTLTRSVKVATDLALTADAVRTVGPFENIGPWPPQADKETTYTVRWAVANSVNTVANAKVTTTLPSYVRFTGYTNPSGAILFNEVTREVTWTLGEVVAGTVREGAFQIGVTPSIADRGNTPALLGDQLLTGFDRSVQQEVGDTEEGMTTDLFSDPDFQSGDGRVQ